MQVRTEKEWQRLIHTAGKTSFVLYAPSPSTMISELCETQNYSAMRSKFCEMLLISSPLAGLVVVDLYADWWVEAKNVLAQTNFSNIDQGRNYNLIYMRMS